MDIESATVPQLLTQYAEILAELRKREVVRTRNAPIGDYAEFLSAAVYDGALEPNSGKSHDLIAADGRLVQVKARTIGEGVHSSAKFSAFRSFEFDVAVFLAFDLSTYGLVWAREVASADVESATSYSAHTNASTVSISTARQLGTDVTSRFQAVLSLG